MIPRQKIGHCISVFGSIANMVGSALNAFGGFFAHVGFAIWIGTNALFVGYFVGVHYKIWKVNSDAKYMAAMYLFFLGTAITGFMRGI